MRQKEDRHHRQRRQAEEMKVLAQQFGSLHYVAIQNERGHEVKSFACSDASEAKKLAKRLAKKYGKHSTKQGEQSVW